MTNNIIELKKSKGPFWRWTLNYAVGKCPCGCLYCYCGRYDWANQPLRIKNDFSKLERQLKRFIWAPGDCAMYNGQWDIMMSSSHDPFSPPALDTAAMIFTYLDSPEHEKKVLPHLRVLSKCWGQGFYTHGLPKGPLYGATITTLDNEISSKIQPHATLPSWEHTYLRGTNLRDEIVGLSSEFSDQKTWISSEPMFKGMDLYQASRYLEDVGCVPEEWWVGHLNIRGKVPDFVKDAALTDKEIMRQFNEVKESYTDTIWYLKDDVKVEVPA